MVQREAFLEDWALVVYPSIYRATENPETVFTTLDCGQAVALFGRAKNDARHGPATGAFADGHRLVTSPIRKVERGVYYTNTTAYTLGAMNESYRQWCIQNQHPEHPGGSTWKPKDPPCVMLRHICETCGKDLVLSSDEAYAMGWDYPPQLGAFGVVSPRTCEECDITTTLWWEIVHHKTPINELSPRHRRTLLRIQREPYSILP